jgi:MFS family permease
MGLICEDKYNIGFIGSAYFIGVLTSMTAMGPLPDAYGRRPFVFLHALTQVMALVGVICLSFDLQYLYFFFGLLGFSAGLGIIVCYNYTMEVMPNSHKAFATTMLMTGASLVGIFYTLSLRYLSRNWVWMQIVGLGCSLLATVSLFMIPESPKYFFMKKMFEKC